MTLVNFIKQELILKKWCDLKCGKNKEIILNYACFYFSPINNIT